LHHRYKASKNRNDIFIKIKCTTYTYALSAKGDWLGLVCMPNNQVVIRAVEDVLNEKMAISKENLDFSFHFKTPLGF
jgi:hypothetical protein